MIKFPLLLVAGALTAGFGFHRAAPRSSASAAEAQLDAVAERLDAARRACLPAGFRSYGSDIVCDDRVDAEERRVEFHWRADDPESSKSGVQISHSTFEVVRFQPNYIDWISDRELLVAGVSPRTGNTIVEVWRYADAATEPSVTTLRLKDGAAHHHWSVPARVSVDLVLDTDDPAHAVVTYAKENIGRTGQVFVRFLSSHAFYELDLATGSLTAVAASEAGAAPLHVPELAGDRWQCGGSAVAHRTAGYVYSLSTETYPPADYRQVNLIDADRDGTIDSVVTEDPAGELHGDAVIASF